MIRIPDHVLEATRLVRAGRLNEATALLRGGVSAPKAPADSAEPRRARPQGAPPRQPRSDTTEQRARPAAPSGTRFEQRQYRGAEGSRPYKLYTPASYAGAPAPLIVMLHGCTQSPDDFAAGTRMNEHAEANGFLVLYPGQTRAANSSKCWNWFMDKDQARDRGEPAIMAGMVREVMQTQAVDPARIFVAGLSAGGAAAATLGVLYPDVFAAIGVHSGLACGAARDLPSALSAMQRGADAFHAGEARRSCPAIIFHGDGDATVNIVNSAQVAAQAGGVVVEVIDEGVATGGRRFTRTAGMDRDNRLVLERWVVHGGGHAWFGGSTAGSHTDPSGPDASAEMVRFFLNQRPAQA